MGQIARYFGHSGSYPAARDLFQLIADARTEDDAYGPEHPATLADRGNLALWIGQAGDAAAARDRYAALVPIGEQVSGPEHPDTLITAATSPAGPGRRGTRPPPATSTPPWCPFTSRCWAPSTRTP